MGKSSVGRNIPIWDRKQLGTGLVHGMIGAGKQCKFREERECKDRTWTMIREHLHSNQHQWIARIQLGVEGETARWTKENLLGKIPENSKCIELRIKVCCRNSYMRHNDWVPYVPWQAYAFYPTSLWRQEMWIYCLSFLATSANRVQMWYMGLAYHFFFKQSWL